MKYLPLLAACAFISIGCGGGKGKGEGNMPPAADAARADVGPVLDTAPELDAAAGPDATGAGDVAPDTSVADENTADTPAADAKPPAVTALHAGFTSTCAVFDSGRIKCWGANRSGQLGLGDTRPRGDQPGTMGAGLPPVELGDGARVVAMAIGAAHACALLDGGQIKCWGDNTHGQLGAGVFQSVVGDQPGEMGDKLPAIDFGEGRRAVSIAAGPHHNCAVLEGGAVKCWGHNTSGNLGLGMTGAAWPPEPGPLRAAVDLGTGRSAIAAAAGGAFSGLQDFARSSAFSCALLDNRQVKCWGGDGIYGAVGEPRVRVRGAVPGDMGDNMPALRFGGRSVHQAVMGAGHGCAVLDDHQVRCWGNSHQDQDGRGAAQGTVDDPYVPVNFGPGRTAIAVAVSAVTTFIDEAHSCAVLDNASATCWGANWHGQLGQPGCPGSSGSAGCRGGSINGPLPAVDLGNGRRVQMIAPGGRHTCALIDGGQVKCWGDNEFGQLGLEDIVVRGMNPGDLGDHLPVVAL
jgi:alpha-tubulin suppressor-like RCC1 family protein